MIKSLDQMVEKVLSLKKRHRIAIAWAQDTNTIGAILKAVQDGFIEALMIGNRKEILKICDMQSIDQNLFTIIDSETEYKAANEAVRLAKSGEADIVMKGLIGTDKFLKAVMDKENGIMLPHSFAGDMEFLFFQNVESVVINPTKKTIMGIVECQWNRNLERAPQDMKKDYEYTSKDIEEYIKDIKKSIFVVMKPPYFNFMKFHPSDFSDFEHFKELLGPLLTKNNIKVTDETNMTMNFT